MWERKWFFGLLEFCSSRSAMWRRAEASAPPEALEAGADGKRWAGRRVNLGKGGKMMGKRTGFSHFETALTRLFPHDSTQVVDFPRMYAVSVFWEAMKWVATDGTGIKHGLGKEIEPKEAEPSEAWNRFGGNQDARNVTGFYAKVREVSRKSTKVRTDQGRGYAMFGFPSPPQVRCPKWVARLRKRGRIVTGGTNFFNREGRNG